MSPEILGDKKKRKYDEGLVDVVNKQFEQEGKNNFPDQSSCVLHTLLDHFVNYLNSLDIAKYLESGSEHHFLFIEGEEIIKQDEGKINLVLKRKMNDGGMVNNYAGEVIWQSNEVLISPGRDLKIFFKQYAEKFSEE
ncbi:hypothetical protein HY837_06730 [archaeon]|nr:hypothetical protein [archaeon]